MNQPKGAIMKRPSTFTVGVISPLLLISLLLLFWGCVEKVPHIVTDPLPSWNEGTAKQTILTFVKAVSDSAATTYVPPQERIATFDNDGTLWAEKPFYFQFYFTLQRVRDLAPEHPDWKTRQPFKAVLENDSDYLSLITLPEIFQLIDATHTGITVTEFENQVRAFLGSAKHPRFQRLFTECVYQPMLELIRYLQANDFKVFICSGGGMDFIRQFSEEAYGIPRENVIGTAFVTELRMMNGRPELLRTAEFVKPLNDKEGKPVGIQRYIGRRPILAFGNSDGDIQMLQFAESSERPHLSLLLHHNDAEREFSYTGGTEKALEMAKEAGWTIVYVKEDFKVVFPFETGKQEQ